MELDFKTVRALSSPTRIKILNQVLEEESTPTSLSDDLDRSKSTVSSHLDTLVEAELVEKDEEDGRRRVVYHPTSKAEAIVQGRERTVKFSLASSIVSGIAGVTMVGSQMLEFGFRASSKTYTQSQEDSAEVMMESMDAASEAGRTAAEQGTTLDISTAILLVGLFFISISVFGFLYGLTMNRLTS